ncbi:hypothetical protein LVJ59_17670 [Microbacterium sp. KKR3/1]|uniref:hypothetical protein n=1 Tax=Microbacterium sp. KKR3/1 TaxID=2904241 RepID=UPI001E5B33CF|nr:hypothetical protein [Microbacterium sp. KKR3/1]MCE0510879.1 hypothetical protein [Microbacterium sp. KKR3/1]
MTDSFIKIIQSAVTAEVQRDADERGQIGIGELAALLREAQADKPVVARVEGRAFPVSADVISYRGYYDQLAIKPGESATAATLASTLTASIGSTFYGYKGGEYAMSRGTAVWVSGYGEATGWAVTGVIETDAFVILIVTVEEW